MKAIIIYYSYSGNTKKVMQQIQTKLMAPLIEIEPVVPYTNNYNELVEAMQRPDNPNLEPKIKDINTDISNYDMIILGTPVWWYTIAAPIRTFLKSNDLSNKVLIPVATNGGWIGHTFNDIKKLSKAQITNELNLKFDGDVLNNQDDLNKWLENVNNKMKEEI
jgi:flavodoxin